MKLSGPKYKRLEQMIIILVLGEPDEIEAAFNYPGIDPAELELAQELAPIIRGLMDREAVMVTQPAGVAQLDH